MDTNNAELEILEALDSGEISKEQADELMASHRDKNPTILDEMHPDIGFLNRAVYKNFGDQGEQGLKYLQKKLPGMEFRQTKDGVIARNPGEQEWRRLDEKGFGLQDISDGIYDVGQGLAEGTASVAGGLLGGAAGLATGPAAPIAAPGLAITGAGLAGGATAAAGNSIKQGLGNLFGVRDGFDGQELAIDSAFGAASPLLLGTGAGAKQVAKHLGKKQFASEAAKESAQEALLRSQSGAARRALGGTSNFLGSIASGQTMENLRFARNNLGDIAAKQKAGTHGAEVFDEVQESVWSAIDDKITRQGDELGQAAENANLQVNLIDVEKPYRDLLEKYEKKAIKALDRHGDAGFEKKDYLNYIQLKDNLDTYSEGGAILKGVEVKDYLDNINEITQIAKKHDSPLTSKVKRDLKRVSKHVAGRFDKEASQGVAGKAWKQKRQDYAKTLNIRKEIGERYFKNPETTETTLKTLNSNRKRSKRKAINQALDHVGVSIDEKTKQAIAYDTFINPSLSPVSSFGTTSTSRTVPLATAGGLAGYYFGGQEGEGHGGGALGAGLGGFLGAAFGSPYAIKKALQSDALVKGAYDSLNSGITPNGGNINAAASAWRRIREQDQQQENGR